MQLHCSYLFANLGKKAENALSIFVNSIVYFRHFYTFVGNLPFFRAIK